MNASAALVLSPAMGVESIDGDGATLYLRDVGTRVRVPLALHRLLLRFERPTSREDVAGTGGQAAAIAKAIANFEAKGFLVPEGAPPPVSRRLLTAVPVRLFDCPALKDEVVDVAVLGVPSDAGDRSAAGARQGPSALREVSLQLLYGIDRRDGRALGWYDADRRRQVLAGVGMGDLGDVFVDHGEGQAAIFARISQAFAAPMQAGALPVLIGGDVTVSFALTSLLAARGGLGVLRLGSAPGADRHATHGVTPESLERHVLALPGVASYAFASPGKALSVDVPDEVRAIHLGIDVASFLAPGSAEGFAYAELRDFIVELGRRHVIAGIDLVGLSPMRSCWGVTAMTALHHLVTAVDAAKGKR